MQSILARAGAAALGLLWLALAVTGVLVPRGLRLPIGILAAGTLAAVVLASLPGVSGQTRNRSMIAVQIGAGMLTALIMFFPWFFLLWGLELF